MPFDKLLNSELKNGATEFTTRSLLLCKFNSQIIEWFTIHRTTAKEIVHTSHAITVKQPKMPSPYYLGSTLSARLVFPARPGEVRVHKFV